MYKYTFMQYVIYRIKHNMFINNKFHPPVLVSALDCIYSVNSLEY